MKYADFLNAEYHDYLFRQFSKSHEASSLTSWANVATDLPSTSAAIESNQDIRFIKLDFRSREVTLDDICRVQVLTRERKS